MGYKLYIKCDNGNRFLCDVNYATNAQAEKAREFVSEVVGIKKEELGIASFCDICKKEREIYAEGCCKRCFEKFVSAVRGGTEQ